MEPKAFPKLVRLHMRRCPQCRAPIKEAADLYESDGIVRARCRNPRCAFSVDLFWTSPPACAQAPELGGAPTPE